MSQESPQQPESVNTPRVSSQVETEKAQSLEKENISFPKKQVVGVWRGIINLLKTAKLGTSAAQEKKSTVDNNPTTTSVANVIDTDLESEEEVTTIPEVSDSKASESDTTATITEEVIDTEFSELETTTPEVIDRANPVSPKATSEISDTEFSELETTTPEVSETTTPELATTPEVIDRATPVSPKATSEISETEFSELETTTPEVSETTTPELATTPEVIDRATPVSPKATSEISETEFSELETTTPEVSDIPTPELETKQTVIQPTPNLVEERSEEKAEVFSQPKTLGLMDRILPTFPKLQAWWDLVLDKIRSFLPVAVSEKLNDLALTGIVTGLVVTILWVSVALLPEPEQKVVELPPSVAAPSQLQAPQEAELVETFIAPPPSLTPEQSLIAAIQKQVGEFTNNYAEGLIKSIQANFTTGRLTVQVGDDWYQLASEKQDSLAAEILMRAKELDFSKLEIHDSQGTTLARNPVVGRRMVILLRQRL